MYRSKRRTIIHLCGKLEHERKSGTARNKAVPITRTVTNSVHDLDSNSSYGSVLKELGGVEIDAIFLDGKTLASGAAATVKGIANPIKLSKLIEKVLQQHVILMPTVTM
ncbi:UNVERIFIED_CONTAM: hypothetical protein FKN15_031539 [Acipenser sinensis]